MRVSRDSNMPTPISNQNVKVNLEGRDVSHSDKSEEHREESCLLTQPTHLLSESIFTDRNEQKDKFYGKNNTVNGI